MLKLFGVIITVAVASMLGFRASERLRKRYKTLLDFYLLLGEISDKMRIGTPLDGILKSKRAERLCEGDGCGIKAKPTPLCREDEELLREFFSSLGMSDTDSETARCAAFRGLLEKRVNAAEREVSEKARLYGFLGVFFGIFISILLI